MFGLATASFANEPRQVLRRKLLATILAVPEHLVAHTILFKWVYRLDKNTSMTVYVGKEHTSPNIHWLYHRLLQSKFTNQNYRTWIPISWSPINKAIKRNAAQTSFGTEWSAETISHNVILIHNLVWRYALRS